MECKNPKRCNEIKKKRKPTQIVLCELWQGQLEHFLRKWKQQRAKIVLDKHYLKRGYERVISQRDLITVLENGEVIEQSKKAERVIRIVVFSFIKTRKATYRPIHVVLQVNNEHEWTVITAYSPESQPWKWTETYDERICFCKKERI